MFSSRAITRSLNNGGGFDIDRKDQKGKRDLGSICFLHSYFPRTGIASPISSVHPFPREFPSEISIDETRSIHFPPARFDSSTDGQSSWEFDGRMRRRGRDPCFLLYRSRENVSRERCAARSEFGAM